jgi:hypothetical protein
VSKSGLDGRRSEPLPSLPRRRLGKWGKTFAVLERGQASAAIEAASMLAAIALAGRRASRQRQVLLRIAANVIPRISAPTNRCSARGPRKPKNLLPTAHWRMPHAWHVTWVKSSGGM